MEGARSTTFGALGFIVYFREALVRSASAYQLVHVSFGLCF
jgi:hypothetical protein